MLNSKAEFVSNTKEGIVCQMCVDFQGVRRTHKKKKEVTNISFVRQSWGGGGGGGGGVLEGHIS